MAEEDLLVRADDSAPKARALPANIEAEAAFLGAVLIDNRVVEELDIPIRAEHFFEPVHQRVFARVVTLLDRNAVVTPVTLKPYFESDEALRELVETHHPLAKATKNGD